MSKRIKFLSVAAALSLAAFSARSQATGEAASGSEVQQAVAAMPDKQDDEYPMKSRISFSFRLGFDVTAKFSGLGGFNPNLLPSRTVGSVLPPGTYPPGDPHANDTFNYDNGYVLVDSFNNDHPGYPGNNTWYYGYDGGSASGSTINMTKSYGQSDGTMSSNGDVVSPGLEIVYDRQLGRLGKGRWGLEGAVNFAVLNFQQSGTAYASTLVQNYGYQAATTPVSGAFYGNYYGPDPESGNPYPQINADVIPTSQVVANSQTINGQYSLDSAFFGFRFGPFLEYPLGKKFSIAISGGLTVGLTYGSFNYTETTSIGTLPPQTTSSYGSGSDAVVGGYASGTISYQATETVNFFTGVQWQSISDYKESFGGKSVELDFGSPLFFVAGIGFSF